MKRQISLPASSNSVFFRTVEGINSRANKLLNSVFELTHEAALVRSTLVGVGFLLIWMALSFTAMPSAEYQQRINTWSVIITGNNILDSVLASISLFTTIFLNGVVIRHLLALYVPFWLMQQVAAIYLADIFEIDDKVAHQFIRQAAFAETYNTIHIRHGGVAEEDLSSPMIQIGGPGYVVVELDSAAVFEKPDGSARVIGPNSRTLAGSPLISGFERIRKGVDLRDIIQKQEFNTRSRDGIQVIARDIQYSYSIYRGRKPVRTTNNPYPCDDTAVLNLVYDTLREVGIDMVPSVSREHEWQNPLPDLIFEPIADEMSDFINRRGLSDFLVTLGKPEDETLDERRKATDANFREKSGADNMAAEDVDQPVDAQISISENKYPQEKYQAQNSNPNLEPRIILTNLFYNHFQNNAPRRGVQLNWVGVGTWDTPAGNIPKNHREAYKISRENFARGNDAALRIIHESASIRKQIDLLENSVLRKYYNEMDILEGGEKVIIDILHEYLVILENARELFRPNIPDDILKAIRVIEHCLYPAKYHSVGDKD